MNTLPPPMRTPEIEELTQGKYCHIHIKVGGEYTLSTVMICSEPYSKDIGKGKSTYIEIFGYGIKRRGVNVKKLRVVQ